MSSLVHHKERSQITLWNHFSSRPWNNKGVVIKGRLPYQYNIVKPSEEEALSGPAKLIMFQNCFRNIYNLLFSLKKKK